MLDAPVDTNQWFGNSLPFQNDVAVASERTLNAWFKTCRAEGTAVCPFGAGDPEAAFDTLIDTLEAKPLKIAPSKADATRAANSTAPWPSRPPEPWPATRTPGPC
ncbi:hypothetical protein NKH18_13270 [Streptomyces sp. M10(2022)]